MTYLELFKIFSWEILMVTFTFVYTALVQAEYIPDFLREEKLFSWLNEIIRR